MEKELHKRQNDMKSKYPEAKMFSEMDFNIEDERCPFCNEKMHLAIEDGGPWSDIDENTGYSHLEEDAIGKGNNTIHRDYEGGYTGYYEIYYRCPHCGKVFYITFEV